MNTPIILPTADTLAPAFAPTGQPVQPYHRLLACTALAAVRRRASRLRERPEIIEISLEEASS